MSKPGRCSCSKEVDIGRRVATPMASSCGIGPWCGRRRRRGGDVTGMGATEGATAAGGRSGWLHRAPAPMRSKDAGVEVDKPVIASCRRGDRFGESVARILDADGRALAWPGSRAMPCRVDVTRTVTHPVRQCATGRNFPQRSPQPREGACLWKCGRCRPTAPGPQGNGREGALRARARSRRAGGS